MPKIVKKLNCFILSKYSGNNCSVKTFQAPLKFSNAKFILFLGKPINPLFVNFNGLPLSGTLNSY
ncbi:MAG TPA: hypothetical protein VGF79_05145 [Bacteroidia bacterium]